MLFFFSSRRRHTRLQGDWSSDVCSSDLASHSTRIAIAASPAPRNTPLIRNISRITTFPPSMIRAYGLPRVRIGRAWGGEGVRISVVAVSLKKKKTTTRQIGYDDIERYDE